VALGAEQVDHLQGVEAEGTPGAAVDATVALTVAYESLDCDLGFLYGELGDASQGNADLVDDTVMLSAGVWEVLTWLHGNYSFIEPWRFWLESSHTPLPDPRALNFYSRYAEPLWRGRCFVSTGHLSLLCA
jgi:hypothetical protein